MSSVSAFAADSSVPRDILAGNFMYHPIRWGLKLGAYSTLRKVASVCIAIFLSLTIIGLIIVIPGLIEWNRQITKSDKNEPLTLKGKGSFLHAFAKLNNDSASGEINGIYITTNESNLDATRHLLEKHPHSEQAIHIGCATWHNFDIMCARKSKYGLIVDFNPKNADFIKKTLEIIKGSDTRYTFKKAMISYLNSLKGKERNLFFHPDQQGLPTDRIEKELLRQGSWLQTDENYDFIKELVSNDRLAFITETITNSQTFAKIREILDSKNIAVDTVYLSNICNFMKTSKERQEFVNSVKNVIQKDTIFINCPRLKSPSSAAATILHQVPLLGSEILKADFKPMRLFEEIL